MKSTKNTKTIFDLDNYGTKRKDVQRLRDDLREVLYPYFFEIDDYKTLLFLSLTHIKQVSDIVKNDINSIKAAAKIVISRLKIFSKIQANSYFDYYKIYIFGLTDAPKNHLNYLEKEVKDDLEKITDLIQHYHSLSFVKAFLETGKKATGHEENMILDFYNRCFKEQQKILNYYFKGIKDRAVQKSAAVPKWFISLSHSLDWYYDFPYKYRWPAFHELFDYREISKVNHRLSETHNEKNYQSLRKIYRKDKTLFYEKLFGDVTVEAYWQNITFNLKLLPPVKDRNTIFKELKLLFEEERWLSFYALALPQIEGLFTDMVELTNKDVSIGSLTKKVNIIRRMHTLGDATFDYYQYHVPILRNQFAHTGHDIITKNEAYDLLTDLDHLLKIYTGLKNPYIVLEKIFKHTYSTYFNNHKEYADYFNLLNQLKKSDERYNHFMERHRVFEKEYLIPRKDFEFICSEAVSLIPQTISMIAKQMVDIDPYNTIPKNLFDYSESNNDIWDRNLSVTEFIDDLQQLKLFVEGSGQYMSVISKTSPVFESLQTAWIKHKKVIKNIFSINSLLKKRLLETSERDNVFLSSV